MFPYQKYLSYLFLCIQAVKHASQLANARLQSSASDLRGSTLGNGKRGPSKLSKAQILEAALQKHMNKRAVKRAKKGGSVPSALDLKVKGGLEMGRSHTGLTALSALRLSKRK